MANSLLVTRLATRANQQWPTLLVSMLKLSRSQKAHDRNRVYDFRRDARDKAPRSFFTSAQDTTYQEDFKQIATLTRLHVNRDHNYSTRRAPAKHGASTLLLLLLLLQKRLAKTSACRDVIKHCSIARKSSASKLPRKAARLAAKTTTLNSTPCGRGQPRTC